MLLLSTALRLARRLQAAWAAQAGPLPDPAAAWRALDHSIELTRHARRRLALAMDHGLFLIRPELAADLAARLGEVLRQTEQLRIEYTPSRLRVPELGEWYHEVRQLEEEFGELRIRWDDKAVRVVTDPIVLEDVHLGPFAIDFFWDRVGRVGSVGWFDVIALDPNPAAGRDDVTHPHVRDRELCAGDAAGPIRQALSDGRLADAFLLVQAVLSDYNPASPYVPLAEWKGHPCADCGRSGDPDDCYSCEACGADLCDGCAVRCMTCSEVRCTDCLDACATCRELSCPGCLLSTASGRKVCGECLTRCSNCSAAATAAELAGPARLCPKCYPEEIKSDEDNATDSSDPAAAPIPTA